MPDIVDLNANLGGQSVIFRNYRGEQLIKRNIMRLVSYLKYIVEV